MNLKKYPFEKQKSSKTCAVASLSMIIKYYKGFVSQNRLEEITKTTKNGTTAYHLIEGAKTLGFEGKGLKINLDDLKKIVLPCIAHVVIDKTYNHYVVIYEVNYQKKYLIIADPATKLKRISFNEFSNIWDGIIISLIPIKKIPIIDNEIGIKKFFFRNVLNYKSSLLHLFFLSCIITILSVISSFSFKLIIDNVIVEQSKQFLTVIFISFCTLEIMKILMNFYRNKILIFLSHKIDYFLTNDVFKKIINLPYQYYRNHTTGDITSRISDLKSFKEAISKVVLTIFVDVPLTLTSTIILYFVNKKLFMISIIIMLLLLLVIYIFKPFYRHLIDKIQNKNAEVHSYMVESIEAFETVKGLGIDNEINKKFNDKYFNYCEETLKLEKMYNVQETLKSFINDIGTLTIIFVGSILVLNGEITLGVLLSFTSLLNYFTLPIRNILEFDMNLKESSNAIKRILELFQREEKNGMNYNIKGNIEYKNLDYSYDDYNMILEKVNLNIHLGEKVMIIGSSGTGKSTLLKLLMKFYKVKRNMVFIDNVDINDYSEECLKNNICYISQKEMLFTDTLYNNLKLDRDISDEQLMSIVDTCYIKDIYRSSNLGINTLIEENGFNLSGGEAQRIVLGRSLLKNFNILIIDEGLNQVDISLERKILKNIFKLYHDKTIIVISHRTDNMDLYDRVVKMENGKVKENVIKNGWYEFSYKW